MRNSILKSMPSLLLLLFVAYSPAGFSREPLGEVLGYSSEDFGGGSYLGVDTRDVTADRLGDLKLKEERGVEVTLVDQDAPAGKAGLKEHDVILTLNGVEIESVEQLRRMIREIPPGRVVTLGISRDGQPMALKAQLADRKMASSFAPGGKPFKFVMPAMPAMPAISDMDLPVNIVVVHSSARSGLMVENLTAQLGDFFGARNGEGVLVRSVEKGSRAEKAGFRAGDVIIGVNSEPIHDAGDFTHALHARKDNSVRVGILRDKKEQTLTLTLPEHKQSELFDESFELPDLDSETRIDLNKAQAEIAHLKPALEREIRLQTAEIEREKPEIEQATRELRSRREELQRELRDLQRELRDQERKLREELKLEFHGPRAKI